MMRSLSKKLGHKTGLLLVHVLGSLTVLFTALSLLSYTENDASYNVISDTRVHNWLGTPGAVTADLLIQTFGYAAYLLLFFLSLWAVQSLSRQRTYPLALRILALVGALFGASWTLAFYQTYAGGALGELLLGWIPPEQGWGLRLATLLAMLAALGYAASVSWQHIKQIGKMVWLFFDFSWLLACYTMSRLWMQCRRFFTKKPSPTSHHRPLQTPLQDMPVPLSQQEEHAHMPTPIKKDTQKTPTFGETLTHFKTKHHIAPETTHGVQQATLPHLGLLKTYESERVRPSKSELASQITDLTRVLKEFGIEGTIHKARPGPVVTLYELEPAPGIKSSRVISLADDIARSMSALATRVSVIPGRNIIGIELPNKTREMVFLQDVLSQSAFTTSTHTLPLALGKDIAGDPVVVDLARMPHLLIAGTTGSGKSVGVNTMILSLLFRLPPDKCQLLMIDPKMLELSVYNGIPHLIAPVITDPQKAVQALKWAVQEMERRYKLMSSVTVRNIDGYNKKIRAAEKVGKPLTRRIQIGFGEDGEPIFEEEVLPDTPLPYIVIIVDEMADLMLVAGKEIEGAIQRLAQMARAAGLHLMMATQRPSVDVLTGTIKANFPSRLSFQVTSKIDSRTILGEQGAEQLLGRGDMLYMPPGDRTLRVHGPFVSDEEVESIVSFLKTAYPKHKTTVSFDLEDAENFSLGGSDDKGDGSLYDEAVKIVLQDRKASTSYIQRRLSIGYNRAANLIEQMEARGIVSPPNHTGKRTILQDGDGG